MCGYAGCDEDHKDEMAEMEREHDGGVGVGDEVFFVTVMHGRQTGIVESVSVDGRTAVVRYDPTHSTLVDHGELALVPVCGRHGGAMAWVTELGWPGWICARCLEGCGDEVEYVGTDCDLGHNAAGQYHTHECVIPEVGR